MFVCVGEKLGFRLLFRVTSEQLFESYCDTEFYRDLSEDTDAEYDWLL